MKRIKYLLLLAALCFGLYGCSTPADAGTEKATPASATNTPEPTAASATNTPEPTAASATNTPEPTATATLSPTMISEPTGEPVKQVTTDFSVLTEITLADIPAYTTDAYYVVNENVPFFVVDASFTDSFEVYSELDELGRCGIVYANIGQDLMPTEERESIGSVKPSGWVTAKYDIVDGKYLYNRCHLIGFQLCGENANKQNLITGTRYMNVDGMLPFENMVADYVKETGNHVMYRVLPMFDGDNLVATGVLMEAWSVEDEGDGICFNVFVYNIQPGIEIDYATGESRLAETVKEQAGTTENLGTEYVLNTNTMKFHEPSCSSTESISEKNRKEVTTTREDLIKQGYEPCGRCKP